jgi:hyperosmotically inducible protein
MKNHIACITIITIGTMMLATGCDDNSSSTTTTPTSGTTTDRSGGAQTRGDADNTARNRGDGESQNLTPIDQSQSMEHIKLTADIRRALMNDETMSMNAQNCKIITDSDGVVTLRGVVHSSAERDAIEAHARRVAVGAVVVNQLEIKRD